MAATKSRTNTLLPMPPFFNEKVADDWSFEPDTDQLPAQAAEWQRQNSIPTFGAKDFDLEVVVIDGQKDFAHKNGKLYVSGQSGTGGRDASVRTAKFILANLHTIKRTKRTFDTHRPFQIFFVEHWVDRDGKYPPAHTDVDVEMILSGELMPNPVMAAWLCNGNYPWLQKQAIHYARELMARKRYKLHLWPGHTILGNGGHALLGIIQESVLFHSYSTGAPAEAEVKGTEYLTEAYAATGAEVTTRWDTPQTGEVIGELNVNFIEDLAAADAVAFIGFADSHCVAWTIDGVLTEIAKIDPKLAKKFYLLTDLTDSVVIRDAAGNVLKDYTPEAEAAHARFADAGMHLVESTTPIAEWPGINLGKGRS